MSLYVKASDVPEGHVTMKLVGGGLSTKQVVGKDSSLMIAKRTGGYHSKPHIHDCEQLNYVIKGEIWIFIQEQGFHLMEGDFLRIPPNAVHWSWNRAEDEVILFESHSPALDILPRDQSVILLAEDENPSEIKWVPNIFVSEEFMEVEKQLFT
jgi:mannose-6-phosphate isomerase-like protein (cupin superfamily)